MLVGGMRAKEEVLGLGGMHRCCRPLYLYNCTSCFIGFRGVLCVSFAAGLGRRGFLMINIQTDSHLEPRPALPWIWIYV